MINMQQVESNVKALKELRDQRAILDKKIERLEEEIKAVMEDNGVYQLEGEDWSVSWNMIQANRFNQKLFKEAYPNLFEEYKTLSESRRFIVE